MYAYNGEVGELTFQRLCTTLRLKLACVCCIPEGALGIIAYLNVNPVHLC